MQMAFDLHIGIDYSGAETAESRLKALQIYAAADGAPERVCAVPEEGKTHWNWSRREIAEWLIAQIQSGARIVAGIDHAFSFPLSYMERYGLKSWDAFLDDFVEHCPHTSPTPTWTSSEIEARRAWAGPMSSVSASAGRVPPSLSSASIARAKSPSPLTPASRGCGMSAGWSAIAFTSGPSTGGGSRTGSQRSLRSTRRSSVAAI